MEQIEMNKLLLLTAFSCMACDGHIDDREVKLIRDLHRTERLFGDIEIESELDSLLSSINKDGQQFLKNFFQLLSTSILTAEDELRLIEVAIGTIKADNKVEYGEIKFFKVIRSKLKISDDHVIDIHPDFEEYLEQDVFSPSYLAKLQDDYLGSFDFSSIQMD